ERFVDSRGMQRKVLADLRVIDGDARVLADEVALVVGDIDIAMDRLEDALAGDGRLAFERSGERIAQVLWNVLQRPDVEMRRGVLDGVLKLCRGVNAHAVFAFS